MTHPAQQRDLQRQASEDRARSEVGRRAARDAAVSPPVPTIRRAVAHDARAIARLAALDSAPAPAAPILIAERDGAIVAAIGGGAVVADPFVPTAEAVAMLIAVRSAGGPRRRGRAAVGLLRRGKWALAR